MREIKDAEKEVLINQVSELQAELLVLKLRLTNREEVLKEILLALQEFINSIKAKQN